MHAPAGDTPTTRRPIELALNAYPTFDPIVNQLFHIILWRVAREGREGTPGLAVCNSRVPYTPRVKTPRVALFTHKTTNT